MPVLPLSFLRSGGSPAELDDAVQVGASCARAKEFQPEFGQRSEPEVQVASVASSCDSDRAQVGLHQCVGGKNISVVWVCFVVIRASGFELRA